MVLREGQPSSFLYIYIQTTVISVIIYIIYIIKNRNKEQPDDTTHNNLRSVEQQHEIRYTCTEKSEKISEKIFKIIFKKTLTYYNIYGTIKTS